MLHAELAAMPAERFQIVVYGQIDWKSGPGQKAMSLWFWRMLLWIFTLGWLYRRQVITFEGVQIATSHPCFVNIWMKGSEADAFLIPGHRPSSETYTGAIMPPDPRIYFVTVDTRDLKRLPKASVK